MFAHVKRWHDGESEIIEFENDTDSSIVIMPMLYAEYHWSAKIARAIVGFYLRRWQ